jgi:hypothetical protein
MATAIADAADCAIHSCCGMTEHDWNAAARAALAEARRPMTRLMPVPARAVSWAFVLQDRVVSLLSVRLAQKIRCNTGVGHFHKWHLGYGSKCSWCAWCVKYPKLQWVIPFSEDSDWR